MWPSGYGVRLRHSFCYSFCAFFLSCETRRFASLSAQFFLLDSFGFPTQKKEIFVTRKKKKPALQKTSYNKYKQHVGQRRRRCHCWSRLQRRFIHLRKRTFIRAHVYLFMYRFIHSLSLSLFAIFFLFCSVAPGEFDIFATAKAASSPSLTLLFLLLLLLPFTTRNNYKHSQMSSPSTRLLPIAWMVRL